MVRFSQAVVDGRPLTGAEIELRSAYGMTRAPYEIPHELFEPREEKRAATPAPSSGTPVAVQPTQPFLYRQGVAGFLGIDMPRIASGTASYPILSTGTPAGMKAKGGAADETVAAFTVKTSTPKRVTGSFRVQVEDLAVFPQMEDSLRRDIPAVARQPKSRISCSPGTEPLRT